MNTLKTAEQLARDAAAFLAMDSAHIPAIETIILAAIHSATAEQDKRVKELENDRKHYATQVQTICEALGLQPACHFSGILEHVKHLAACHAAKEAK